MMNAKVRPENDGKVWLVTGVAGFIGSNLLEALLKSNQRVICISPPKRASLFGGRKVSFYNVAAIVLKEILE
jgi:nucleoside-diphosphate-sugar epimerase